MNIYPSFLVALVLSALTTLFCIVSSVIQVKSFLKSVRTSRKLKIIRVVSRCVYVAVLAYFVIRLPLLYNRVYYIGAEENFGENFERLLMTWGLPFAMKNVIMDYLEVREEISESFR